MILFPVIAWLALVVLAAGYFGLIHPAFDSLCHFRPHLAGLAMVAAIPAFGAGWKKSALITMAAGAAALFSTYTWVKPANVAPELGSGKAPYRLLHMNLRFDNKTPERVFSLIAELQPDVVTLNEVSDSWLGHLEQLSASYPYQRVCKRNSVIGGVAVMARRRFAATGHCLHDGAMAIQPVDFDGVAITFVALHLHWPWPFQQSAQIGSMAHDLRELPGGQTLITGDLNAAPWSAASGTVASLSKTRILRGIGATWRFKLLPAWFPYDAGLPIDQVLAGSDIRASARRIDRALGSDHLPLMVNFKLSVHD